jgi:hypothetical protein
MQLDRRPAPRAGERDDAALLRAVARGDEETLAVLYDRHADRPDDSAVRAAGRIAPEPPAGPLAVSSESDCSDSRRPQVHGWQATNRPSWSSAAGPTAAGFRRSYRTLTPLSTLLLNEG